MKHLKQGILCLSLFCIYCMASAQETAVPKEPNRFKPKLFKDVPDRVPVSATLFVPLLTMKAGQAAGISLSPNFRFEGRIVSTASKYNNTIKSFVLKSTDREGASLTISQITLPDGSVSYRGRIISFSHGDCFELKTDNGQYVLVKRNFEDMVND
jgi:hypothetical protein